MSVKMILCTILAALLALPAITLAQDEATPEPTKEPFVEIGDWELGFKGIDTCGFWLPMEENEIAIGAAVDVVSKQIRLDKWNVDPALGVAGFTQGPTDDLEVTGAIQANVKLDDPTRAALRPALGLIPGGDFLVDHLGAQAGGFAGYSSKNKVKAGVEVGLTISWTF